MGVLEYEINCTNVTRVYLQLMFLWWIVYLIDDIPLLFRWHCIVVENSVSEPTNKKKYGIMYPSTSLLMYTFRMGQSQYSRTPAFPNPALTELPDYPNKLRINPYKLPRINRTPDLANPRFTEPPIYRTHGLPNTRLGPNTQISISISLFPPMFSHWLDMTIMTFRLTWKIKTSKPRLTEHPINGTPD